MKVQTKLPVFEAFQWTGDADDANNFFREDYGIDWEYLPGSARIEIKLESGPILLQVGDWVVTNDEGAFAIYTDERFHKAFGEVVPCETS